MKIAIFTAVKYYSILHGHVCVIIANYLMSHDKKTPNHCTEFCKRVFTAI